MLRLPELLGVSNPAHFPALHLPNHRWCHLDILPGIANPTRVYNHTRSLNMPLFICNWQNGDFSAVSASSKKDAIELLDEAGNAETCELFTMKNFMVHFRLKEETYEIDDFVPVELDGFGEQRVDMLCDRVYPKKMQRLLCAQFQILRRILPRCFYLPMPVSVPAHRLQGAIAHQSKPAVAYKSHSPGGRLPSSRCIRSARNEHLQRQTCTSGRFRYSPKTFCYQSVP
jgi:hypothetical protein